MNQHVNIKVEGGVQGVGFRWAVQARARLGGLTGFVLNEDDGSVSIEVEGPPAAIETFVAWCHHGPPSAMVDRVTVTPGVVQGFSIFEIRY
jgi:acylphosphatase